ncbi:MAG TPA: argininosuccinate lyase [Planctomycetota bacterium]|nr:argininosuccinate lyase [Planctomycetota bacterium]
MTKLWGGRFAGGQDPVFESFHRSLGFDRRLVDEDVRGSVAWANALADAGVLAPAEAKKIVAALAKIAHDDASLASSPAEDVHSFVEARLGELVGDLAKKLHTGRSRNDQVATDLRLWAKSAALALDASLHGLASALADLAERHADLALPGYTHLQRAQPITAGHHALAYVEMLARDRGRLADAAERADVSPLGCGALAGTAYAVDRAKLAFALGFREPARNSLDAVSDRDFACEIAFACALAMTHLSRFAEDWIFFASQEAGFIELGDEVATGSSLMPQKKNPDALELVRGKCGRVLGRLTGLLATLKGLPLAYDKDLQEDKEALFECVDTTRACLDVAAIVVRTARFREERCRAAAAQGYLNATDLADLLVKAGVPFRDAHERAGRAVRAAIEFGVEIEALPAGARKELLPELARVDLSKELSVDAVLARRSAIGGTAPKRVLAEARAWKKKLATR